MICIYCGCSNCPRPSNFNNPCVTAENASPWPIDHTKETNDD